MSEQKGFNRWLIVVGALLVQLCLGAVYAWSVFRKPLEAELGITPTQATLPFSFVLIFFALATVLGGRIQDRFGPRAGAIMGGILLGVGMILSSLAQSVTTLILSYGVISGIGIGFAYVCPISAGVKWFPDKRGLITGLAVAGFGAGALIVGPLAARLIGTAGVFPTFRYLGIAYVVVVILGALILRNPPAGYRPAGWTPPQPAAGVAARIDYTTAQMLGTSQFWLIWILYFIGAGSGLMIIGQTSPIAQELGRYSKATAALGVSVLAIFNALGRILWGRLSDSIGRTRTLFFIYLINGLAVLSYFLIPAMPFWFWIGIALVGATFGGYLAIYPAMTTDFYGTKSIGINYGMVFTAYGVGGLLGNLLAPLVKQATNNYNLAFILSGVLCLAASVVIHFVKAPRARAA